MSTKTYAAQYWRNDGDWHETGYDNNPVFIFHAENDDQARELASAYIGANKQGNEDFFLKKLARLNFSTEAVEFKDDGAKAGKPDANLETKLAAAKFTPLRDAILLLDKK